MLKQNYTLDLSMDTRGINKQLITTFHADATLNLCQDWQEPMQEPENCFFFLQCGETSFYVKTHNSI